MKQQRRVNALVQVLMDDQQADGLFLSYSIAAGRKFGADALAYHTTFMPALIVGALTGVDDQDVAIVRERATEALAAQRGPQWSFNYWTREAPEATSKPYPDDWDDTSCAVIALTLAKPELVTAEALGHVVTLLTNTEMEVGGPYRTWIVGADADAHWQDVDVAVNANIAYMLKLHGVDLPNLERLADEYISEGRLASPYYPSAYPIEYFLSRWYGGEQRERLREQIMKRQKGGRWGNPLDTALAMSACLNLGAGTDTVAEAADWLRKLGADEIKPQAFCLDPAIEGVKYVAGSRALTAALCLEALATYDRTAAQEAAARTAPAKRSSKAGASERIHAEVVARVTARLEEAGPEIGAAGRQVRDRLLGGTAAGQVTLLPYLFRQALGKAGAGLSDARLAELGVISLYGWMAYTVYDDFLDEEGKPPMLPMANVAMRELVLALEREARVRPEFGGVAWSVLDRQEAANAWEVSHCRVARQVDLLRVAVPDFGDLGALAERSMGHALGAVAMAAELGHGPKSAETRALQEFFYHFLIARQLSDDALDWKDDLQKGQINAVGAHLLQGVKARGRSVRGLYAALEQYFWEHGIREVNEWMFDELKQARAALRRATLVERPEALEGLLAPIETAARESGEKQRQTAEFLRAYRPEGGA